MKNKKKKSLLRRLSSYDDIKATFTLTREMVNKTNNDIKKEEIKESFKEALDRLGIPRKEKKEYLEKLHSKIKLSSIIYFVMATIIMGLTTYNVIKQPDFLFVYIFYIIGATLYLKSFQDSFRCYQIRKENLFPLKDFIKKPKEWIPTKYTEIKSKSNDKGEINVREQ